ncbi:MAG TPA: PAS domain S-box protein, partial [Caldilineaceae bacterium]|nr:PAS domain S-box protein [Caldilineaceae bacterium]
MEDQLKVLMVEDSEDDTLLLCRELKRGGYTISYERVETAQAFATALDGREWDLIIADYNMPQFSGLAALQLLQARGKDIPFLVISGFIDETIAVAAMKSGAQDYLMKDNLKRLAPVVERELRDAVVRRKRRQAEEALRASEARLRQANDALLYLARSASVQEGNLAAAFGEITEIAGLSLGVSRASIWLFNPEHTRLICHELFELDDNRHSRGQVIEVDCCPRYLTALNEHRFISTHDSHLDPRTKEFYESYTAPAGIFSSVEATIRLHSQVVGTFVLEQRHAQRHWRPDEESFVSSVADLVSLALGANQRQQAEEALRQSEQRYRDLFENANDMIYTLDLEGCFTSINRRGEELTGYTRDELISRSGEILMSPGDLSVSREHLRRKLSGESVHTV